MLATANTTVCALAFEALVPLTMSFSLLKNAWHTSPLVLSPSTHMRKWPTSWATVSIPYPRSTSAHDLPTPGVVETSAVMGASLQNSAMRSTLPALRDGT